MLVDSADLDGTWLARFVAGAVVASRALKANESCISGVFTKHTLNVNVIMVNALPLA